MIHMVGTTCVDINGTLFPATNIQISNIYPELTWNPDHKIFYGLYFEMMFENGYNLTVYQKATDNEKKLLCDAPLDHFIVDFTHKDDGHQEIISAYHCVSEDHLRRMLNEEKFLNVLREEFVAENLLIYLEDFYRDRCNSAS